MGYFKISFAVDFSHSSSDKRTECVISPLDGEILAPGFMFPSLEAEMTTHSSILAWRILWTEEPGGCSPLGHKESDTTERLTHTRESRTRGRNFRTRK